ncbi:DNA polymerase III subunit gamma and tau [Nocardioides limicola]|uniref:DNA polymerase III subunit gamma and tau n=1 Tax=Nocardioides limicola TaxID=2803368 RepID=UPI00193B9E60|nr:DNA polymerase III subunit gamma and tau [Nocardioides sp. DJM-14]
MDSPLALYRRYRPETFAEVVGQDHVTEPLRAALANNRVNHAYLFSGPRGCGKTTSARILARALNCEKAPIADPCGECESCQELARGGPGSIDVIEIDAASHGGVDDARDLREKAFFAPVKSRYKVYIIDEAHMVTTQGFNALLKLVEEPPPHLRFIFATTEPEKVIPTIRSRTHHYPFRLIPPRLLSDYLAELCRLEEVQIEPAALPLVVRAGAGSARDTLSVLDQLLGGAGPAGVTHKLATDLLGYTPDTLLDDVVDAFAAGDGAGVFGVVDRVIETGQDPRRFAEDLLRRLRDLVIINAVPDAPATGLIDVSEDAAERLVAQAARFGGGQLARAADLLATGLTEMRGATAPRLLLELICARVLLPAADDSNDGVLARLDRLERRMSIAAPAVGSPQAPAPAASSTPRPTAVAPAAAEPAAEPARPPAAEPALDPARPPAAEPAPEPAESPVVPPAPAEPAASSSPQATSALNLADVRRLWPDVVEATKKRRRVTWIHLTQHAQVVAVDGNTLTLGFSNSGARESFAAGGSDEIVRQAALDVIGHAWTIDAIVDPGATAGGGAPAPTGDRSGSRSAPADSRAAQPAPMAPPDPNPTGEAGPPDEDAARPAAPTPDAPAESSGVPAAVRDALRNGPAEAPAPPRDPDADVDPDDPVMDDSDLAGAQLLQRELGAQIIDEIPHN